MTLRKGREAPPGPAAQPELPEWVLNVLRCPVSGAELELFDGPQGVELVAAEGADPRLAYPVRGGIPVLLEHEARQIG